MNTFSTLRRNTTLRIRKTLVAFGSSGHDISDGGSDHDNIDRDHVPVFSDSSVSEDIASLPVSYDLMK